MMVIRENRMHVDLDKIKNTSHIDERKKRLESIPENNWIVKAFWVNKGHPNGPEIHIILTGAAVLVINARTMKLCTILFARVGQIKRYYRAIRKEPPQRLIEEAYKNEINHLNELDCI